LDYCITTRAPAGSAYGNKPGKTAFVAVPDGKDDFGTKQRMRPADWVRAVLKQIPAARDATGMLRRDLLVFIHGYDNTPGIVLQRHRRLRADLRDASYVGGVVSFDWPSGDVALAYLDDREKAKQTAFALVRDCIELFARTQLSPDCDVNVHLLAHSTGAYVVREASTTRTTAGRSPASTGRSARLRSSLPISPPVRCLRATRRRSRSTGIAAG
jgi:alpha-beta hydrolase superfamily lysophospholipase